MIDKILEWSTKVGAAALALKSLLEEGPTPNPAWPNRGQGLEGTENGRQSVTAPARPGSVEQGSTESRPTKKKTGTRGARPSRNGDGENRLERTERARAIVLGLPQPVSAKEARAALAKEGIEIGNCTNFFSGMVKAGTMKKIATGSYARTDKPLEKRLSAGEELEARKAALGIAVKKKEEE